MGAIEASADREAIGAGADASPTASRRWASVPCLLLPAAEMPAALRAATGAALPPDAARTRAATSASDIARGCASGSGAESCRVGSDKTRIELGDRSRGIPRQRRSRPPSNGCPDHDRPHRRHKPAGSDGGERPARTRLIALDDLADRRQNLFHGRFTRYAWLSHFYPRYSEKRSDCVEWASRSPVA